MRSLSFPLVVLIALLLAACGNKAEAPPGKPADGAAKPGDAKPSDGKPAAGPAGGGAAKPPMALPVKAVAVTVGPFSTDVTAVGSLLADESVLIRSEIDGRVTVLHFEEGQAVAKGARLVSFDASEYQAALAASSAELRTKTSDHERAKDLLAKGFVSVEVVDRARGAMEVAAARVQQDQARLAKTAIFAPFSGVMGLRQISPGAYLKTGDNIARVESIASIKLDFRVPETYVGRIARGQPVAVSLDAFPGEQFQGRIFAIEPLVDEKSRTVLARAHVPNTGGKLKPGLFARVSVQLDKREQAISIPEQSIVPQGKDTFVYKVLDNGAKTQITKVQIGGRRPGVVEITGGLAAGDMVVTEGALKLAMMPPGAPVTVMVLPAAGAPPAPGGATAPGAAPAAAPPAKPAEGDKKGG